MPPSAARETPAATRLQTAPQARRPPGSPKNWRRHVVTCKITPVFMKRQKLILPRKWCRAFLNPLAAVALVATVAPPGRAATNAATVTTNLPSWLTRPLSLADCLDLALQQNGTILKAKSDLEASHGIVVQTRAIAIPKVQATGNYTDYEPKAIDKFPFGGPTFAQPHESWNAGIQIVQSVYEGGRLTSAFRTAKLTKEQALFQYQTVVADTLLATRVAYYDVLVAAQQIVVREASVSLLSRELEDQQRRFDAGTVPRFNVLRAEVAVANARPALIRARNAHRLGKNNLVNLLGYNLPREIWEDVPLQLSDPLEAEPHGIDLPAAIAQALEKRTELAALRKAEELQQENIVNARSGYKPSVQLFAGYGWRNSLFTPDLSRDVAGWNAGAQLSWNIFDGLLTRGKITQARALHEKSKTEIDDTARRIELEVRTAYSFFVEAREVLESQKKVQEQAEEALRLARARADAGTGTQLDVLDAQTSLTEARTTQVQALHDYAVARARLERAIGQEVIPAAAK
jgi:outer membrane protein